MDNTSLKNPLLESLEKADHWEVDWGLRGKGPLTLKARFFGPNSREKDTVLYTLEEFNTIDRRYGPILSAMCGSTFRDIGLSHDRINMLGEFLAGSYHFLSEEAFGKDAGKQLCIRGFNHANAFTSMTNSTGEHQLTMHYAVYLMHKTRCGIEYAYSSLNFASVLDTTWLDNHCPDWEQRMEIAASMDMPQGELGTYVLFNPSDGLATKDAVQMEAITFDVAHG